MMYAPSKAPAASDRPGALPFVCPACRAPNVVDLVALSRATGTRCVACHRTLRINDVIRARHSPRVATVTP